MTEQNFSNHTRMVPLFHYGIFSILLVALVGSIMFFAETKAGGFFIALVPLLLTIALLLTTWFTRSFSLKAQDRAIRAEENLRHYVLTGKLLDGRLRMGQIVALRFASDAEFAALATRAVAENMDAKAIKQAIQNWKPDYNRV